MQITAASSSLSCALSNASLYTLCTSNNEKFSPLHSSRYYHFCLHPLALRQLLLFLLLLLIHQYPNGAFQTCQSSMLIQLERQGRKQLFRRLPREREMERQGTSILPLHSFSCPPAPVSFCSLSSSLYSTATDGSSFANLTVKTLELSTREQDKSWFSSPPQSMPWSRRRGSRLRSRQPQLLKFQEPSTNVTVYLVGAMHYNPTSIQLASDTVNSLAEKSQLGSVIVESCDVRWNKTRNDELRRKSRGTDKWIRKLLTNEMRTASDVAHSYGRPVILGDQRINVTTSRMGETLKATFIDLVTPLSGGWRRFYNDVSGAASDSFPSRRRRMEGRDDDDDDEGMRLEEDAESAYIGLSDFFDSRLLLASPVSLVKYPLSLVVRSPFAGAIGLLLFFLLLLPDMGASNGGGSGDILLSDIVPVSPSSSAAATYGLQEQVMDWIGTMVVFMFEVAILSRVFVKTLLAERNEVLARNILEQCKIYALFSCGRNTELENGRSGKKWRFPAWSFLRWPSSTNSVKDKDFMMAKQEEYPWEITYLTANGTTFSLSSSSPTALSAETIVSLSERNECGHDVATNSIAKGRRTKREVRNGGRSGNRAVVAVVGMAHCNGIMKLLKEERIIS